METGRVTVCLQRLAVLRASVQGAMPRWGRRTEATPYCGSGFSVCLSLGRSQGLGVAQNDGQKDLCPGGLIRADVGRKASGTRAAIDVGQYPRVYPGVSRC